MDKEAVEGVAKGEAEWGHHMGEKSLRGSRLLVSVPLDMSL